MEIVSFRSFSLIVNMFAYSLHVKSEVFVFVDTGADPGRKAAQKLEVWDVVDEFQCQITERYTHVEIVILRS